jgi:hypothetical protein
VSEPEPASTVTPSVSLAALATITSSPSVPFTVPPVWTMVAGLPWQVSTAAWAGTGATAVPTEASSRTLGAIAVRFMSGLMRPGADRFAHRSHDVSV